MEGIHFSNIAGGIQRPMPRFWPCAYVLCTDVEDEINHSCAHGKPSHRIKVVIVKMDNKPKIYEKIKEIARQSNRV